jgi:hypothetical protein
MVDNQKGQAVDGFVIRGVGVVGFGHMGDAFAVNLVEDGYRCPYMTETRSGQRRLPAPALLRNSLILPIAMWW